MNRSKIVPRVALVTLLALAAGCAEQKKDARPKEVEESPTREKSHAPPAEKKSGDRQAKKGAAEELPTTRQVEKRMLAMKKDEVIAFVGRPDDVQSVRVKGRDARHLKMAGGETWEYNRKLASDQRRDALTNQYRAYVGFDPRTERVVWVTFP